MSGNTVVILELVLLIGIVVWVMLRKKKSCTEQYDEMQLKIRAKGYQISFFTALAMLSLLTVLLECGMLGIVTPGFAAYAALMVSVTVFAIYCILHDAFLAVRGNPMRHLTLFGIIVVLEGFTTVRYLLKGELLEGGMLTFGSGAPVVMFVCFLAILITLIVKTVRNRKEAEE